MGRVRDGTTVKDPPGDQSYYIISGDIRKENYRAFTLRKFKSSIDKFVLAKHGFYYLGYRDMVKCCSKINKSTKTVPASAFGVGLPAVNLMYTTCCNNVVDQWTKEDDPSDAKWHKENCQLTSSDTNIPIPRPFSVLLTLLLTSSPPHSSSVNSANEFPCREPHTADMSEYHRRLETFAHRWPQDALRATVEELARCGLFYLGESDRTSCYYCGGGLQNFEYEDDPWFEHAKWYPGCEFILSVKGIDFVRNIYQRFPNLPRPHIEIKNARIMDLVENGFVVPGASSVASEDVEMSTEHTDPVIIDFLENSSIVNTVREMGFNHNDIKEVISRKFRESSDITLTVPELVESIMKLNNERRQPIATIQPPSPNSNLPPEEIQRLYQETEREGLCKICFKEPVSVLFMPCGHIASCSGCSNVRKCPICSFSVTERINFFRS